MSLLKQGLENRKSQLSGHKQYQTNVEKLKLLVDRYILF